MLFKVTLFTLAAFVAARPDQYSSNVNNYYLKPQAKGFPETYGAGPEISQDPIKRFQYVLGKKKAELDALAEKTQVNDDENRLITSTVFKDELVKSSGLIKKYLDMNSSKLEDVKAYLEDLCDLLDKTLAKIKENKAYTTGPNAEENAVVTAYYQKECDAIHNALKLVEAELIVTSYITEVAALNVLTGSQVKERK